MATSPTTSLSLLERLREGDADSWRRMFTLYSPLFRAWLRPRGLQPADIDDLTQNALTVTFRRLKTFQHNGRVGAFRTWLRGIVGNVLREQLRAAGRQPVGDDRLLDDLEDPASELVRWWDVEHDRFVLRGLLEIVKCEFATATWAAFTRTVLDGCSAQQVAEELGISINAVHIARSRVTARLRQEAEGFVGTD